VIQCPKVDEITALHLFIFCLFGLGAKWERDW
jgi:hypothetical protein